MDKGKVKRKRGKSRKNVQKAYVEQEVGESIDVVDTNDVLEPEDFQYFQGSDRSFSFLHDMVKE